MRIFVYEHLTGGGLTGDTGAGLTSFLREGRAMFLAIAEDFAQLPAVEVTGLWDSRLPGPALDNVLVHRVNSLLGAACHFEECVVEADWSLIVAPEFDGILVERAERVLQLGGRLLGPAPALIALCSDKRKMTQHLEDAGVPTPESWLEHELPSDLPNDLQVVRKPRFGAGSVGVQRTNVGTIRRAAVIHGDAEPYCVERYCPGLAASVAAICGPRENVLLAVCRQHLSADGCFQYQGGSLPLPEPLAKRAANLARRAIESLPSPTGYLGLDLILDYADDGRDDVVIEINPRATTSYVGLRQATKLNLAACMLQVVQGGRMTEDFAWTPVRFTADGEVHRETAQS